MNYLLGSGYYQGNDAAASDRFAEIWVKNLDRFTRPRPQKAVILSVGDSIYPSHARTAMPCPTQVIDFHGNLGHVHHLLNNLKPHVFGGWSASVLALAMLAYNAELDFVYREQDVLAFGPYIEKMYSEIRDGGVIFGSFKGMPCAQSLFLVKHNAIPTFVRDYLNLRGDRDVTNLPEHKFALMERGDDHTYRRFSFGYDRDRPINFDDPVFYAQRLTHEEITCLRHKGLL